jgi:hypothetical protein
MDQRITKFHLQAWIYGSVLLSCPGWKSHQISKRIQRFLITSEFGQVEVHTQWQMTKKLYYVGPCHHGTERPRVADGKDGLQIRRVAANILKMQSRTADKG